MTHYVPAAKMSKKAQKQLAAEQRKTWGGVCPVTQVKPNKKQYDRKKMKRETVL